MHQFPCPHCSTRLRFRDNEYRNRTIACPECHQPVLVEEKHDGTFHGRAAMANPVPAKGSEPAPAIPVFEIPKSGPRSSSRMSRVISLGVAGMLCLGLLIYTFNEEQSDEFEPSPVPTSPEEVSPAPQSPVAEEIENSIDDNSVEARLKSIHRLLSTTVRTEGTFPAELAGPQLPLRSWIAELAETALPAVPVHWDRGWAAPVNDEFVRRRFPAFENPLLEKKVGDDHYPATHFVGLAGVGPEAAKLPKTDPRAGVFGERRSTQLQDIKDGLAQTIMIMGVEKHLGSWARPGEASIRALTQTPYLRGPDGFGTGQSESMMVLMADGSVRTISAGADPVIMRRMAAMADGFSLDPQAPGDPLVISVPKPAPAEDSLITSQPAPAPAEVAKEIDLRPRLQQRILEFSQPKETPLETILFEVQELIGMPIDISALTPELRQTPVSVSLGATTVKEVLDRITQQARVTSEIQRDRIVIRPASK
jgi:hypothetical protein